MKVSKYFKYLEAYTGSNTFSFGWTDSDKFSIADEKCVLAINLIDTKEISVATLSDYIKYSKSLTGFSPKEFLKVWKDDLDILEETQRDTVKNYVEGQGRFLYDLNNLLLNGEQFVFRNIKYKII